MELLLFRINMISEIDTTDKVYLQELIDKVFPNHSKEWNNIDFERLKHIEYQFAFREHKRDPELKSICYNVYVQFKNESDAVFWKMVTGLGV